MSRRGFEALRSTAFKASALTVAAAIAVTGAVFYPGFDTADVELNDGGVWVVNKAANKVGHLNYQSRTLDGGLLTPIPSYDLAQNADKVFVRNLQQASLTTIDPAMVAFADDNSMPANTEFSYGSKVIAVADADRGMVYGTTTAQLAGFASQDNEPLLDATGRALSVVGADDTIWAVDLQESRFLSFTAQPDGSFAQGPEQRIDGIDSMAEPQLSAVGDTAVLFDAADGRLITSTGITTTLPDPGRARLQVPGPETGAVAIALGDRLAEVPLDGSAPIYTQPGAGGRPIAPVRVGGCTHAVWTSGGSYLRSCDDAAQDESVPVPGLGAGAELAFRVNRDVVVLNDVTSGRVWLVNDGLQVVDNWSDLDPPKGKGKAKDEDSKEITDAIELPKRGVKNKAPIAKADRFGVRAGRTTLLPVLFNDVDPDGDLLVAKLSGKQPTIGTLQAIYDGTGFQLVVPEKASGTTSFSYQAADGRGGFDTARASIRVVPDSENNAPNQERITTLRVRQGESVTQNVLTDWSDPDGDDLQLIGGESKDGDVVRVRPDGSLTFQDGGKKAGRKEITIQVSDGREGTQGRIIVETLTAPTIPPLTTTDHVVANAGDQVSFAPLSNDADPSGAGLRLAGIDDVEGLELNANPDAGTVTLRGKREGTYYAKYVATNGPASAPGLVRIDIRKPEGNAGNPIAVRDTGLLPAGGNVLVNVLGNDSDPAGGVLVLTGTDAPAKAPFSVSVERNSFVRITDVRGLTEPMKVSYTVSNGTGSATGEITVIPVPAPPRLEPPRPAPDNVVVRAGDVSTVRVLENDVHPNGAELTLLPGLKEADGIGAGSLISVADATVRFRAGDFGGKPARVSVVYTVAGPDGQKADARINFHIQPMNAAANAAPAPEAVTGRVFAGGRTLLQVPLDGIDPDGDSVSLISLGAAPTKGSARIRGGAIEYTASRGASGTDVFTYVVEDRPGARATGTVMVGIAPLSTKNNPPVAVNDSITVRPSRPVSVDVLANDTDPDGDPVALLDDLNSGNGVQAAVKNGRIVITAPPEKGSVSTRYSVSDGRGGKASATLSVEADPQARLLPPIARDDRVSNQDIVGKDKVSVPLLLNDEDPDGRIDDLVITLPEKPAGVVLDADALVVPVRADPQVIAYTITDPDKLTSTAFVLVPGVGVDGPAPALRSDVPREVMAGDTLALKLGDIVAVRDGRSPRLTGEAKASSVPQSTGALVRSATGLAFTSDKAYSGPASVTFEVTDGKGPDDAEGKTAVLSLPITVLPRPEENQPPTLQSNALQVAAGEGAATLDLRATATDPNPDDVPKLAFALGANPIAGLDVALVDGHTLSVSAPANTPKGTAGTLTATVTDGRSDPVPATIEVAVLASTRELPVANPDTVSDAHQGRPVAIDVLANDHNPYAGEGELKLISATATQGEGGIEVRGSKLAVTPADDFVGTLLVQYTIGDMTGDPDRQVSGTASVNVLGRPAAPGLPLVESSGDRTVALRWDAPANNGSDITHYTVTGDGVSQRCATTTCTLTGLTNDKAYTFSVTATNAVGESDPSAASAEARPDVEPEQPAPPTTTYGDQEVAVAWMTPVSKGSPVTSYALEISPAPANGISQVTGITSTGYTATGLANGTAYQFRVQALNSADKPSEFSSYSTAEIPAGKPFTPDAPVAERVESVVDGGSVAVRWSAPGDNGASLQQYTLRVFEGGSVVRTIDAIAAGTTGQTLTGLKATGSYSFGVTARNKAGASEPSARSNAVTPYGRPGSMAKPKATATGTSNQVRLQFTAPAANGSPITGYQVSGGGGSWTAISGPGAIVGTAANGTPQSWAVRALNAAGPGPESSMSAPESSYGPLSDGGGRSANHNDNSVTFTWNANDNSYANGRPVTLKVTANGSAVNAASGRHTVGGLGYSTKATLVVTATDTQGQSASWTIDDTTNPAPPPPKVPSVALKRGSFINDGTTCTINCYKYNVQLQDLAGSTNYEVKCMSSQGEIDDIPQNVTTDAAGNWGPGDIPCWVGKGYGNPFWAEVGGISSNRVPDW
ncbi:Ig-like domain-containing protein [Paeniglutamicibacter cryotolerans]|uniref:Fibronectin type-III domain-containing protein n=1 Tax=Paeniglutamicibacter cryotolerans TaxID=670079 RepID=A0A839QRZ4_9MICC|nr:Ig-like domain-containing protein [Paeniglutamicibacter cryotolerans]MBB2996032.1 hypothetical protein [Paeniglutamicibacter cryotolerans]